LIFGWEYGFGAGLAAGVISLVEQGFASPVRQADITDPDRALKDDRSALAVTSLILSAIFFGGVCFLAREFELHLLPVAIAIGLGSAVSVGLGTAWIAMCIARFCLAISGQLPWGTLFFLSDAYERGVLRRAGAVYQFRHLKLQQYLGRKKL
jgi:hypothetical protein